LKEKLNEIVDKEDNYFPLVMEEIQKLYYFRPLGDYHDREGNKYIYNQEMLEDDIQATWTNLVQYYNLITFRGYAPEHARDLLYQNFRQNFVVRFNARSLLHFLDLRTPLDAQLEIQIMANQIFDHFKEYMPEVSEYYQKHRFAKNKLSP
jgi:thymidylate synthase (FAD)